MSLSAPTSLGLSILKPDAPIVQQQLPERLLDQVRAASVHTLDEVVMGFYIPQPTRSVDGTPYVNLEERACYMVDSHGVMDVSYYIDTLVKAYAKEWTAMRDGDYLICAQSLFLHNVVGGGVPLHTDHIDERDLNLPHRTFVAMVYMNEGYEGGKIEFPRQGFSHEPKFGDVLIFPTIRPHQVYPLTKGIRHSWQRSYYIVDSSGSTLPRT